MRSRATVGTLSKESVTLAGTKEKHPWWFDIIKIKITFKLFRLGPVVFGVIIRG